MILHYEILGKDIIIPNGESDGKDVPSIHPTQKPITLLKRLIYLLTDPGDVVIYPVAGSGTTLRACAETGRSYYGFEIKKKFCDLCRKKILSNLKTCDLGNSSVSGGVDSQINLF